MPVSSHPPLIDEETVTSSAPLRDGPPSARNRPSLVVLQGPDQGKTLRLERLATVLGRSEKAHIRVADDGVSRQHCRILCGRDGVLIVDMDSKGGTWINGARHKQMMLSEGDKVRIGHQTLLKFTYLDNMEEEFTNRMYQAAVRDLATKAFNKRFLMSRLDQEMSFSRRHKAPFSLLMMDIDHFKHINDTHSHLAGDAVLARLSELVQDSLRGEDLFARYGGEEFAVVSRGLDEDGAELLGERIRTLIADASFSYQQKKIPVTISIGVSTYPTVPANAKEELIAAADKALYDAKSAGRNCVRRAR